MHVIAISPLGTKTFSLIVDDQNDRVIAAYLLHNKIWEPLETRLIVHLVSEGENVIDIGANIGYYTFLL